jgi:hypothetical protein
VVVEVSLDELSKTLSSIERDQSKAESVMAACGKPKP